MAFEKTDIPQQDVDDALILEVGKYSTMDFNYINDQYKQFDDPFNREWNMLANRCFDDYTKCLISQDNPTPVCGYNRNEPRWEFYGFRSFNTYCDAFFDNCRRGYRHWRILDTGKCHYYKLVAESFRKWFGKTSKKVRKFLPL
ncbi:uncharacterized protein LOC115450694 [Manduca sexta]|uniref:uncharacterized protein LOC115450694 n=1 Tax=Manduca sexta TaxID=7130 RepID=UPI00188DD691|nr:uncharacterized protein LOC115450694 [Manduca sexta]